jgi:pullulanase/glycogen debranching enzyme
MYEFMPGSPLPLGSSVSDEGVNFSIFSREASAITLVGL